MMWISDLIGSRINRRDEQPPAGAAGAIVKMRRVWLGGNYDHPITAFLNLPVDELAELLVGNSLV